MGLQDRQREALHVVEASLAVDDVERARFVADRCASDAALLRAVTHLLRHDAELAETIAPERRAPIGEDQLPERIGPFRVTGLLGRGGMGTVVAAERDDGLYAQRVAIKLLRPELAEDAARARFTDERRILARLSHPGIARILDGGEHDGRPYLVMEFVDGQPVTHGVAARWPGLDDRLDAWGAIADAVAHAHRALVVHADLKPSNVIATADGGIKLLDFGIARLIGNLDIEAANPAAHPMTPGYAAPERLAGTSPTVADDVYGLGTLLHELLAGARAVPGMPMSTLSGPEGIVPRLLRGDLDAIVARAMTADPGQRYPDVAAFVADVRRFRSLRPVAARGGGWRYRSARFLRRNRWSLAIGGAVMAMLIAAAIVSTMLFIEAQRQRAIADARFGEVRTLAKYQLFDLYDDLAEVPGTTITRARLATDGQRYLERLSRLPHAPPDLSLEVAAGFDRLAAIQGVPRRPNLGRIGPARANLARAADILAQLPPDRAVAAETARNLLYRAQAAIWIDFETERAAGLLAKADLAIAVIPRGAELNTLMAQLRVTRIDLLGWQEHYAELGASARETLIWLDRWPATERALDWTLARADALNALGDAIWFGTPPSPEGALVQYLAADTVLADAERAHPNNATILSRRLSSGYNYASGLEAVGRRKEMARRALILVAQGRRLLTLEAADRTLLGKVFVVRELASQALSSVGRYGEAIAMEEAMVADRRVALARAPGEARSLRDLAFSNTILGTIYWRARAKPKACDAWRKAASIFERMVRTKSLNTYDRTHSLAYVRRNRAICAGGLPATAYQEPS